MVSKPSKDHVESGMWGPRNFSYIISASVCKLKASRTEAISATPHMISEIPGLGIDIGGFVGPEDFVLKSGLP